MNDYTELYKRMAKVLDKDPADIPPMTFEDAMNGILTKIEGLEEENKKLKEQNELFKRQRDYAEQAPLFECPKCMHRFDKRAYKNDAQQIADMVIQRLREMK